MLRDEGRLGVKRNRLRNFVYASDLGADRLGRMRVVERLILSGWSTPISV